MESTKTVSDYERERGKPLPSLNHSITQTRLILALSEYEPEYTIFSELTLDLDGFCITPDLSVYPKMEIDFTQDQVRMTEPPLLAVEIESPTQSTQDLVDKARQMIEAGTQSCWIVQPSLQTITVLTGDLKPKTFTEGTVDDPATDITVTLEEIFAASDTSD